VADIETQLGDTARLTLQLADGVTTLFPRATIYNGGIVPVAAVNLDHVGLGMYRADWIPPYAGGFTAVYRVFSDAPRTSLADYEFSQDRIFVDEPDDEPMLAVVYDDIADTLLINVWVLRDGLQVTAVTSCEVRVYNDDNTLLFPMIFDAAADTQGVFRLSKMTPGLVENRLYSCHLKVTTPTHVIEGRKAFKAVL